MSDSTLWSYAFVLGTFAIYIGTALWARASSTDEFYVAGHHIHPVLNGMATAADWMSAASFISMAGLISFLGYGGSVYLMGWTGGFVLLALLLAPYLRKFNKFTVPDFVGDRYTSDFARLVAVICALFVSFTYIAGQMQGVGIAFSRFLQIDVNAGVVVGAMIVLFYAGLGGMRGVTYTQVAQYCVLITAYTIPAIFISLTMTGNIFPQIGFISDAQGEGVPLLVKLDQLTRDLGFTPYLTGSRSMIDTFAVTLSLMAGTAGLPHVIIRFFTVPKASDARVSAGWALVFIALLYTTAPAVAAFARLNFIDAVHESVYEPAPGAEDVKATPDWFKNWEATGLITWDDLNGDGLLQHCGDPALAAPGSGCEGLANEVEPNRDIMVLANPEIARLPAWVIGLVVAGGLAAALSTAAGLLLVISSAVSHDLCRRVLFKNMTDQQEMLAARLSAVGAVLVAIYAGVNPPDFVAAVVAFAFGLAAASFFPVILLGVFWRRMNKQGAIAGMLTGLIFTAGYIAAYKVFGLAPDTPEGWWFGISPEGVGVVGMAINFAASIGVSLVTAPPPAETQALVDDIRLPSTPPSAQAVREAPAR